MILLILILIFQQSPSVEIYAANKETYFARIMFDQVYLYKTPSNNDNIENIYFELPRTYFVELINDEGDYYKVNYLNLNGYVKKECVQAVATTPSNPYLNSIYFRVYSDLSENLWSSPKSYDSSIITPIPHLTNNIQYLGKISGESLISGRTNYWYYCKYSTNQNVYYGYVYSDFCDNMTEIVNNTENLNYINNPNFQKTENQISALPQKSNYVGIIIGILSIPSIIFTFLVFKGTKFMQQEKTKRKEVVDY